MAQTSERETMLLLQNWAFQHPRAIEPSVHTGHSYSPLDIYKSAKQNKGPGHDMIAFLRDSETKYNRPVASWLDQSLANNQSEPKSFLRLPRMALWAYINSREDLIPILAANEPKSLKSIRRFASFMNFSS